MSHTLKYLAVIFATMAPYAWAQESQIIIENASSLYDCCATFTNGTGQEIVHVGIQSSLALNLNNQLIVVAAAQNQPTCNDPEEYFSLFEVSNPASISKITIEDGNAGNPAFTMQ